MTDNLENFKDRNAIFQYHSDEKISTQGKITLAVAVIFLFFTLPMVVAYGTKAILFWITGFLALCFVASSSWHKQVAYIVTDRDIYKRDLVRSQELWRVRIDALITIKKKRNYYVLAIPKKKYFVYNSPHGDELIGRLRELQDRKQ